MRTVKPKYQTMSTQNQTEILVRFKLVIDKKRKKILYAEADKTFFDVIFAILRLPVEEVVKLLSTGQDSPMVGSLGSLYRSLEALNITYYNQNQLKADLPTPITQSQILRLLQNDPSKGPKTYYACSNNSYCRYSFSATYNIECPKCHCKMVSPASYVCEPNEARPIVGDFLKGGTVTYIVMDDLTVKPLPSSTLSICTMFYGLNLENVRQLGVEVIDMDMNDVCDPTFLLLIFLSSFHNHLNFCF